METASPAGKPKVFLVNILLVVVTVLVVLLRCLSLRRSRISRHALGRYFLAGASALYFSLISYFFSYLTNYMSSLDKIYRSYLLLLVVLIQFLNSNADMAALAVAAVASPTAGDDIDSQKIRPSMESLVSSLWVAGLVIYYIFVKKKDGLPVQVYVNLSIVVLWALGVARMVLRFVAFQRANGSFGVGRNAQLIEGYMAQLLQQQEREQEQEGGLSLVPHLILTGEEDQDVEESPQGYRVKEGEESTRLVTLDKVWSSRLSPDVKDLCLSFCLFKCLRRRFAGYPLAEAGSSWAFRFVCDGLLGQDQDDHVRMFKVISGELDFASDFYYSPIPVASLGACAAALHFFLSALICSLLFLTIPLLLFVYGVNMLFSAIGGDPPSENGDTVLYILGPLIAVVTLYVEIAEMVHSLRSNWTKISMVGHYINQSGWSRIICPCLLKCKPPVLWKDDMRQNLLLRPVGEDVKDVVMVSQHVKDAVIRSLKGSGGQLSNGVATVRRRCPHFNSWACYDRVTTSTDTILVWYIATFLVEINCSSSAQATTKMAVATSLSRYCAYLVADAPDLLPDNSAGTKHRYRKVKKCIEETANLVDDSASEMVEMGSRFAHQLQIGKELVEEEVVNLGSKLGKELVEEVKRQTDHSQEVVWEILVEFWSEMILYLAPSDNVKGHIESLRRGGELITLLWALLLHAGITSRAARHGPIA